MKGRLTRILSAALVSVMVISAVPKVNAYSGVADWAAEKVAAMDSMGLIPDSLADADLSLDISRLDMARVAMLAHTKITGIEASLPDSHPFTDTTDPDVEKAYSIGLISGNGDGTFRPDASLTRAEFFCIVVTYLDLTDYPLSSSDKASLSRFSDADSLPDWAYERTQLAVGLGLVAGTGNALSWQDTTAAQEALIMFHNAYALSVDPPKPDQKPDIPAPDPSGFIGLSDWASDSVHKMSDMGLIPDEIRSTPMNGIITRTNMAKVMMLAYKQLMGVSDSDLGQPTENPFTDTNDLDVLNAYRLGLVSGKGNGVFGANDPITRQDFFTIAAKFLNVVGYDYSDDQSVNLSRFHDSGKLASYATAPARLLISIGALAGDSDGYLNPTDDIVCQESLCIFFKIHQFVSSWDGSPDSSIEKAEAVVAFAKQYLGYDYVYGGKDPETGFDCSGFIYYVYKNFGYTLYPGADNQWDSLSKTVSRNNLLPGDLVFFSENGQPSGISHAGIYIGNNEIIHASTPSTGVIISNLDEPYYAKRYLDAKRVIE